MWEHVPFWLDPVPKSTEKNCAFTKYKMALIILSTV